MQPFTSVLSDPMLRNGYAPIVSATVTQVLGVLYWIVAARTAPAAVLGRNSAAIYMMMFLAGVAELNLMSTLVRFLPTSGKRTARLIVSVYAASAAVAAVLGLGDLDRAHTHAITARAAADAAENLLRAALADGAADQA